MKITQCQLSGHIFMFETPLEVTAQFLRDSIVQDASNILPSSDTTVIIANTVCAQCVMT